MRALHMELYKCRRRRMWLAPALILAVQLAWGFYNLHDLDAKGLVQGWANILYTFPVLNAMMIPILAAVVASRAADMEHAGQTLKLLATIQRKGRIFDAKFIVAAGWVLIMLAVQMLGIVGFGLLLGFAGPVPWAFISLYFLSSAAITLTILLMQLILSLLVENQLVSMILGLIGAFVGLFSLFFPQGLQKLCIWAYYGVLYVAAMDWDRQTRATDYYFVPYDWGGLLLLGLIFAALYIVGRWLFVRKEA